MKEQKFRFAFATKNEKKFVGFGYRTLDELLNGSFEVEKMKEEIYSFDDLKDTVGLDIVGKDRYTGLKDAFNKNEVYDHDIINYAGHGFLKVEWDYRDTGWVCFSKTYKKIKLIDVLLRGGVKVGNIYENLELFKGQSRQELIFD